MIYEPMGKADMVAKLEFVQEFLKGYDIQFHQIADVIEALKASNEVLPNDKSPI